MQWAVYLSFCLPVIGTKEDPIQSTLRSIWYLLVDWSIQFIAVYSRENVDHAGKL
jgi:hypothetical protein